MPFCFSVFYLENLLPDLCNRHGLVPKFPSSMDWWPAEGLPRWFRGKESAYQCRKHRFSPGLGKIPWRREWQSTQVFLPGESHGHKSLAGYSPWGHRVRYNWACMHTHTDTMRNSSSHRNEETLYLTIKPPTFHRYSFSSNCCKSQHLPVKWLLIVSSFLPSWGW